MYVFIYCSISCHRYREKTTHLSNLTVRVADKNAFTCWKAKKPIGFGWNIMLDGKQGIAVKADLML